MNGIRISIRKNCDLILHGLMCCVGGFLAGYAVLCRGNLGSAQTMNLIDLVFAITGRKADEFLLRFLALFVYILGIYLVALLSKRTHINIQRYSILIDMAGALALAFIPEGVNPVAALLPMFFMLSTQWSVFHGMRGYNSATVFSTNNLRQAVLALNEYAFTKEKRHLGDALYYLGTLFWFYVNVALSYFLVRAFGTYASLFAIVYALPALLLTLGREKAPEPASPDIKTGRAVRRAV